jgi:IS5 family transposase
MLPKHQETIGQTDLFKTALADLLNPRHELVLLAGNIDWQGLDSAFGEFFTDGKGAPALPSDLADQVKWLN